LKLKINKGKSSETNPFKQPVPDPKNQKIIATIQRIRQGGTTTQTQTAGGVQHIISSGIGGG